MGVELPAAFAEYTAALLGNEEYERLVEALAGEPPVSVRVNPAKWRLPESHAFEAVPWSAWGVYLPCRPSFTFDPLFHAGAYYVQEASSMFVEQVIRAYVKQPCVALDLCAAPGGKSTLMRTLLPEGSLLVSNEVIRTRAQVLAENMIKWGHPEVVVTNNDPSDFGALPHLFDLVLADVPCSGEGMFRKDEEAVGEWSAANVEVCWQRQRRIVEDIWRSLKPGGLFVYSTCTYNAYENEENVRWIQQHFGAEVLPVPVQDGWGVQTDLTQSTSSLPVCHFIPSHTKGEGFFLALLRKPAAGKGPVAFEEESVIASVSSKDRKKQKQTKGGKISPVPQGVERWLCRPEEVQLEVHGEHLVAFPKRSNALYEGLRERLRVLHAGILLAEQKGRDWIPHHALAMSTCVNKEAFAVAELSLADALAYLRREAVVLPATLPKGIVMLTYRRLPIGFAKNIGNRANNLYPQEWRIRSSHMPEGDLLWWE
ncbi:MAG: rRNA cytosine-C5-methyltransferase [Bacteroidaceae bacterium]|nr:rRNA cytosine-C5-methyltransferase [Bacteroidaceae bacterium]